MPKVKREFPVCEWCQKFVKYHSPIEELEGEKVCLHRKCAIAKVAKKMTDMGYAPTAGQTILNCAEIPIKRALGSSFYDVTWAPIWAVTIALNTRRTDNDVRHIALHTCAKMQDPERQLLFASMVRLGGEPIIRELLKSETKETMCCVRGRRWLKRINKNKG